MDVHSAIQISSKTVVTLAGEHNTVTHQATLGIHLNLVGLPLQSCHIAVVTDRLGGYYTMRMCGTPVCNSESHSMGKRFFL